MTSYTAPVKDMQFVLHEICQASETLGSLKGFEDVSPDLIDTLLEEGAKLCENAVAPTNEDGDKQGCKRDPDGQVKTPDGFKAAYDAVKDAQWMALACNPEYGGQGMPHTLSVCFEEYLQSANMSLSLYFGLTHGAILAIERFGTDELKNTYLPKLVSNEWSGVMCLTEPHCGTDLGLLKTRAEPLDGSNRYALSGNKIFITGGEHDMVDNIVHLVLARLPNAPAGVKGISMFLVPKFKFGEGGSLGDRNAVSCIAIEDKMGIKGAVTCAMAYEEAEGYLIGEPHRGLQAMFTMMNHERIMVGQQGLAVAEIAYQNAVIYARDRLQGRALTGARFPEKSADPLMVHPDIRRMLLTAKSHNEAARSLLLWTTMQRDIATHHDDAMVCEQANDMVDFLTPVIKAHFTDYGMEACILCQQVYGGHGYIKDWGMEQFVRDVRISQIYEGANGVQALDLVGRKLMIKDGRLYKTFLNTLNTSLVEHEPHNAIGDFTNALENCIAALEEATLWIRQAGSKNADELGAGSYDYLRIVAITSFTWMWMRAAHIAAKKLDDDATGFYQNKLQTGLFYISRFTPLVNAYLTSLKTGAANVMQMTEDKF